MGQTNVNVPGDNSSGMGAGMIVGLVLAIVVIGFVVWYFVLNGSGGGTPTQSLPAGGGSTAPSALLRLLLG
jgi:ABC-type transporter Mla subunit MlaD